MANERAARGGGRSYDLANANFQSGGTDQSAGIQTGGPEDWFGPGNPMAPTAPPEVRGRSWDFQSSYNLQQRPRGYENVSFETLRNLAASSDLVSLAIETRKDQIAALEWNIVPRDKKAKADEGTPLKAAIDATTTFFAEPYPGIEWDDWIRRILDDLFTIDAPAVYPRPNRAGGLFGLLPLDGATIKRVIDDWGNTPIEPGQPAYQQILKGLPAVNYTADQLIYRPRNMRTHKAYGFSPVEQILTIINIAIRRETWQLSFFTDGNLPDALIGTPNEWTPDQIRSFQDWFDARLQGNTGGRRGATFVPGEVAKGYVQTKETELFGKGEEWLARVVCFAFSISPQGFVMMMNRATGETQKDSAIQEGLQPIKKWIKRLVDFCIRKHLKRPDLMFAWAEEDEIDQEVEARILREDRADGIVTLDEVRTKKGLDPSGLPEGAQFMVKTSTGFVPLSFEDSLAQAKAKFDAMPKPVAGAPPGAQGDDDEDPPPPGKGNGSASGGSGGTGGEEGAGKASASPLEKREPMAPITAERPLPRRKAAAMTKTVAAAFAATGADVAAQVETALKLAAKVAKADPPESSNGSNDDAITDVSQPAGVDPDALVRDIDLSSLDVIVDAVDADLFDVASDTAIKALAQIGVQTEGALVNQVNAGAVAYARDRAAELVGKRILADGSIVDNPNAKWAITDSTRNMLRETIARGLEDNIGTPAIAASIQESYAFSAERAKLVAHTEVANANEQAKLIAWRVASETGLKLKKSWLTAEDDRVSPECVANGNAGAIELDEDFPSGDDAPKAHPKCRCVLVPEVDLDALDEE